MWLRLSIPRFKAEPELKTQDSNEEVIVETEYLWTTEKSLAHTTSSTHIDTLTCMPAQKPVYIFMFVDIFCMRAIRTILGKKTASKHEPTEYNVTNKVRISEIKDGHV